MKSLLLLTASGPLLILASHDSLHDPKLLEALKHKGIGRVGSTARALGRTIPLRPGRLEIYPFCSRTDGFEDFPRSAAAPPSTVRPPSY